MVKGGALFKEFFTCLAEGNARGAVIALSSRTPGWLFRFGCAHVLTCRASAMEIPAEVSSSAITRVATMGDTEHIARINGWTEQRVAQLLQAGCICFLAGMRNQDPTALTWLALKPCYVRGMGYSCYLPRGDAYGVGTYCLPESRGQGLYLSLNKAIVEFARNQRINLYWVLVESGNERSLTLRKKLGFTPRARVTYLRLLFFRFCRVYDHLTRDSSLRILMREPKDGILVI